VLRRVMPARMRQRTPSASREARDSAARVRRAARARHKMSRHASAQNAAEPALQRSRQRAAREARARVCAPRVRERRRCYAVLQKIQDARNEMRRTISRCAALFGVASSTAMLMISTRLRVAPIHVLMVSATAMSRRRALFARR